MLALLLLACTTPNPSSNDTGEAIDTGVADTDTEDTDTEPPDTEDLDDTSEPVDTEDTDTDDPTDPGASLTIGTGTSSYQPVTALQEIPMIFGPQGGYHQVGAFRICGMPGLLDLRFEIVDEPSGIGVSDSRHYDIQPLADGPDCGTAVDLFGYLDARNVSGGATSDPTGVISDHVVIWTMTVSDDTGRSISETIRVTAVDE